jgi:hypothetical protein
MGADSSRKRRFSIPGQVAAGSPFNLVARFRSQVSVDEMTTDEARCTSTRLAFFFKPSHSAGVLLAPMLALWCIALALVAPVRAAGSSLRCGNDLIYVGDVAYVVERKLAGCGEILSRAVVGERKVREFIPWGHPFSTNERRYGRYAMRTVLIETWFVRVDSYTDYCYELTFEGGRLSEIGDFQQCP